jgi:CelD/BcsL family acetyltransferase involved in cellulose biosynthesis
LRIASCDAEIDDLLSELSRMRVARWGNQVTHGMADRAFFAEVGRRFLARKMLRLTALESGGQVISVMFNARVERTEYFLQLGYDASRLPGASIGYIHLGYSIESAIADGLRQFDLLAGAGKHRGYKHELATSRRELQSLELIRAGWLRALHAIHDRISR